MPTYDQFRAMLPVHKHRLDDELEIQAQSMEQIAAQVVTLASRMIEAKEELSKVEGRLSDDLREEDPKMTIGAIGARVGREPSRVRAWQRYQEARSEHERWVGLLDAWKQKGYSIKTLADLFAAQYFSLSSHQTREKHPQNDPHRQDALRAEMRVAMRRPSNQEPEADSSKPTRRKMISD